MTAVSCSRRAPLARQVFPLIRRTSYDPDWASTWGVNSNGPRGIRTGIFDASDLARCPGYRSAREVWDGLAKNASEGLAAPARIVPWTIGYVLLHCGLYRMADLP